MTPAARLQAAIELLDGIIAAARQGGAAADTLIQRYFRERRYAGSGDRRAVRELVYRAIRSFGESPASGRAAMARLAREDAALAALFDGSPHGPAPIGSNEPVATAGLIPAWLTGRMAVQDAAEIAALLDRAPLDVRANSLKTTRDALAAALPGAVAIAGLDNALRLDGNSQVDRHPLYEAGHFEVQDAGSQHVVALCDARPGMTVIDLCAGAGGKTLGLAAAMADTGRIVACDTDRGRLSRLMPRAMRAGTSIIETLLLDPGREAEGLAALAGAADAVLVDAPCSGSGTWRRNPESRWRINPQRLARLSGEQARLLKIAAGLVRPGGLLVYAVCSLIDDEGAGQIAAFLARNPDFTPSMPEVLVGRRHGGGVLLSPFRDDCDGFFISVLRKSC